MFRGILKIHGDEGMNEQCRTCIYQDKGWCGFFHQFILRYYDDYFCCHYDNGEEYEEGKTRGEWTK